MGPGRYWQPDPSQPAPTPTSQILEPVPRGPMCAMHPIFRCPPTPCPPGLCPRQHDLLEHAHRAGIVHATTRTVTPDRSDRFLVEDHRAQLDKLLELRAMVGDEIDPRELKYMNEVIQNKQDLLAKCDAAIARALAYWTACKEACNAHDVMTCTSPFCAGKRAEAAVGSV